MILALPPAAVEDAGKKHVISEAGMMILADWLEASALFGGGELSKADAASQLKAAVYYDDQDAAWTTVGDVWVELCSRRDGLRENYPFDCGSDFLVPKVRWAEAAAFSYCLFVSCAHWYPDLRNMKKQHPYQGALFERLTEESLRARFSPWAVARVGHSHDHPMNIEEAARDVAKLVREQLHARWRDVTKPENKDKGLDLLLHRPFQYDERPGPPIYLIQCASGTDWTDKLHTPDPDIWAKIVDFVVTPQRAFALPITLSEGSFTNTLLSVKGPIFDRTCLLSPTADGNWLSPQLADDIKSWLEPFIPRVTEMAVA